MSEERKNLEEQDFNPEESLKETILKRISLRAAKAEQKLKLNLTGTILLDVVDTKQAYLFENKNDQITVRESKGGTAECIIKISENDFNEILLGNLNPQVAMLAGKVKVTGNPAPAVYFFNLCVPRAGLV